MTDNADTMIRRTMMTTIRNYPIITLPPPHPEIQYNQFSPEESLADKLATDGNSEWKQRLESCEEYKSFDLEQRVIVLPGVPMMILTSCRKSWRESRQ
jgi:hypothetical protein